MFQTPDSLASRPLSDQPVRPRHERGQPNRSRRAFSAPLCMETRVPGATEVAPGTRAVQRRQPARATSTEVEVREDRRQHTAPRRQGIGNLYGTPSKTTGRGASGCGESVRPRISRQTQGTPGTPEESHPRPSPSARCRLTVGAFPGHVASVGDGRPRNCTVAAPNTRSYARYAAPSASLYSGTPHSLRPGVKGRPGACPRVLRGLPSPTQQPVTTTATKNADQPDRERPHRALFEQRKANADRNCKLE
jgi:hypothetical protein